MGLLSSSVSINRYYVEGKLEEPVLDTVKKGLVKHSFRENDDDSFNKKTGWTSFNNHFNPNFNGSSFVINELFVFSLRIDKKSVSPKIVRKFFFIETAKRLEESGRGYLTANEKKAVKEQVLDTLFLRLPAVPNIYDVVWNYEKSMLWFFSNNKSANEELEILFSASFNQSLIKIFPYSEADILLGLTDKERDLLSLLSPSKFAG
ncbi:MAG: exonuclease [Desulfobacterales bacterium]|nr:exonuclease [Desulfobacterales bacterium]